MYFKNYFFTEKLQHKYLNLNSGVKPGLKNSITKILNVLSPRRSVKMCHLVTVFTGHKGGVQKAPPLFCAKIARAILANLSLGVDHVVVRDVDDDVLGIEDSSHPICIGRAFYVQRLASQSHQKLGPQPLLDPLQGDGAPNPDVGCILWTRPKKIWTRLNF